MGSTPQEYWGHLIDPVRKCPTQRLDSLLSGIAHYIIKNLEPREHHALTPEKLAAFYRSVGGDFDKLFLETSPSSLSFVYQALGCYHSLQPVDDPFKPPAIPALTASGFRRWATIQLLLQPAEQVPLLQETVRRYDISNKVDGHIFPKVLPAECFPRDPDPGMTKWHDDSLQKLKREAEEEATAKAGPRPAMPRVYSGTPMEDDSSGPDDSNGGYFSIARLKGKVASRWDQFRGEGRPSSHEDRDSREWERDNDRRRRDYEGPMSGSYRYHRRPSGDGSNPRRGHPGHRMPEDFRRSRAQTYGAQGYDSPPSSGNAGYDSRRHSRSKHPARGSPLSPDIAGRGYSPGETYPRTPSPPPAPPPRPSARRTARPSGDINTRRHSSHEPISPRDDPDSQDYLRARPRPRSQNGRGSSSRLSPSDAYDSQQSMLNGGVYIPAATTATSGITATAPPAFARGNLRHTVHGSGHIPRIDGVRPGDDLDDRRMNAGVRYVPAERSRRPDRA